MNRTNRARRLILATCAISLLVAPTIWLARQHHQIILNRELIAAINQEDATMVDVLLAAGADPNVRETLETHLSLWQRLQLLVHPPPIMPPTTEPATAIVAAIQRMSPNAGYPPDTVRIVKALLAKGAAVNASGEGYTPITLFFERPRTFGAPFSPELPQNRQLLEALLNARADTEAKSRNGLTPLMQSVIWNWPVTVRILLDHRANVNPKTDPSDPSDWGSPLHWAIEHDHPTIANILKAHGARE